MYTDMEPQSNVRNSGMETMRVRKQGSTIHACLKRFLIQQGIRFNTGLLIDAAQGMLKHRVETDACKQQRPIIQTCLTTSYRMMFVSHTIITIQRVGDRRTIAANKWMRGLTSTTLLSMPPVPLFELHIFHPDTRHAQRSSIRALTYTTQVRSSGSQVFVG